MMAAVQVVLEPWQLDLLAQALGDAISYREMSNDNADWVKAGDFRVLAASLQVTPRRS